MTVTFPNEDRRDAYIAKKEDKDRPYAQYEMKERLH